MNELNLQHPLIERSNLESPPLETKLVGTDNKDGNSWENSMVIILANIMGIGVLGLAHAFAQLGWLFGSLVLIVTLCGSAYAGILLARMKVTVPSAKIYSDIGYSAYGNLGRSFVNIFGYTYIVGLCFSFQVCAAVTLKEMMGDFCLAYCSLIVGAIVLPLTQFKSFQEMTWFIYLGVLSIVFPIFIILIEISVKGKIEDVPAVAISREGFTTAVVACMDVIFAVTGQVIFIEIMSEMQDPRDFPKAVYGSSTIFFIVYITLAVIGYFYIGTSVTNPMIADLSDTLSRRWCAGFVCVHVIIAYVMEVIVLANAFHQYKGAAQCDMTWRDRWIWFLVTSFLVILSLIAGNIMPFISDLMGFVGSICGISTTFVFPFLFAPVLLKMPQWEVNLCRFVAAFSVIIGIIGAYSSIDRMVTNYQSNTPFGC